MTFWGYGSDVDKDMVQVLVPTEHAETVASIVKELDAGPQSLAPEEGLRLVEVDGCWIDLSRVIAVTPEGGGTMSAIHLEHGVLIDVRGGPEEILKGISERLNPVVPTE